MTKKERFVKLCEFYISHSVNGGPEHLAKLLDRCLAYPDDLIPDEGPLRAHADALVRYLNSGSTRGMDKRPEMKKWADEYCAKYPDFA